MFQIVRKKELNSAVTLMDIQAPFIAKKAKAGQFIIFRIDEKGERVPLTIAGYDREKGTVTIIFQKVGFATKALGALNEGDYIKDFVGPLGKPTPVEGKKKVCVVGGGVGCADITEPLRKNNINILEISSSQTAVVLFVDWEDGEKAHKLLNEVLE